MNDDHFEDSELVQPSEKLPEEESAVDREYDRQIELLEGFLSSLQPGTTLLVERLQPSWCSGVLEEIAVNDDTINLAYFIENWGGKVLGVKVRGKRGRLTGMYKIPLHTYPPLRYGDRIYPQDRNDRFNDPSPAPAPAPVVVQSGNDSWGRILQTALPAVMKVMESLQTSRQQELVQLIQLMNAQKSAPVSTTTASQLADILQVMSAFSSFGPQKNENDSDGNMIDLVGRVLNMIGPKNVEPQKQTLVSTGGGDVVSQLSKMGPDQAISTLQSAISKMPPDRADATVNSLLSTLERAGILNRNDDDESDEEELEADYDRSSAGDGRAPGTD